MTESPILTFDCDWAPDFILEDVARILTENKIKSTWFATHKSSFLKKLESNQLFEIGLHPNFSPNSTQGNDPDSVLKNLKKLYPNAKSVRTHSLFQSSPILLKFSKYGIENDSSIYLPKTKNIFPHYSKFFNLFRFPFYWADDIEIAEGPHWSSLLDGINSKPSLKIFNFHPIHIYLNSNNMKTYNSIKKTIKLNFLNSKNVKKFVNNTEPGTKTFFEKIISSLRNKKTFTIQDLREIYKDEFMM